MSNNLYKGVVKLTKEQFDELKENGTITIGSQVYTYSPKDTTYVVEDNMTAQVAQNTSDIAQLKTDVSTLEDNVSTLQSSVQSNTTDITNLETDKLDKNQGVVNAGKVMLVGDDGNLTPQTLTEGGTTVIVGGQPQTTWDADLKADVSSLASVATSGSYEDLTGKPTIPTDNSQLTNGAGYATTSQLPTNNNQLTNGAGYVTQTEVNTALNNKLDTAGGTVTGDIFVNQSSIYFNNSTSSSYDQYIRSIYVQDDLSGFASNFLQMNQIYVNTGVFSSLFNKQGRDLTKLHADYDSGWFSFTKATTYTFTHNLNTTEFYTLIDIKHTSPNLYTQNTMINSDGTSNSYSGGINETYRTATQIWLRGAKDYAIQFSSSANDGGTADDQSLPTGQARVRLFRIV